MNAYVTVNCVGIDVSKGKSTIAIMRPLGEIVQSPFEVKHTLSDFKALESSLRQLEGETPDCNGVYGKVLPAYCPLPEQCRILCLRGTRQTDP